jgi:hypothetical protein
MEATIFVVNEEPYCLWERDVAARNLEFLNGLDPDYYEYSLKIHVDADDEKRASVAIRVSLHHAIETLFSLLGAFIQAPDCAYAWIAKCSNSDLRSLAERITSADPALYTKLNLPRITWNTVAECVFTAYQPGTDRQRITIQRFSRLWETLSRELTDRTLIDEYNSLKHGFRIRSGGFSLAVGLEHERGVPPPPSEMRLMGKCDFGATFFKIETLWPEKKSRSVRSRRVSANWSIERTILLHQLTQMSIVNLVSALKFVNGVPAPECRYVRPESDEAFDEPWKHSAGIVTMSFDDVIDESNARVVTKEELLDCDANREG